MGKSTLKFVNGVFVFALILVSCSGKEMPKENKDKPVKSQTPEVEPSADTTWVKDIHYDFYMSPNFDKTFSDTIDGDVYTVRVVSQAKNEEYIGIKTYVEDGKLHAQKHIGFNSEFKFILYDATDNLIAQNTWDRYDLEEYIPVDLLAGSRGDFWDFGGYHKEFDQFFFTTYWMFEESDVGEEFAVFLDRNMEFKQFFMDSFTGGGACQCDDIPSEDGKTFAFCSRIHRSNGRHTMLGKKDEEVTGSFVLNNEYCLVIYEYEGKPPYTNAKIINSRGVVAKTFDYTGITEALGYMIPIFEVDDQEAVFLLDQEKRGLYRIDSNNPLQVELIDIDAMEKMEEGEVLNERDPAYLEVTSETKTFYFEYRDGKFRYFGESQY